MDLSTNIHRQVFLRRVRSGFRTSIAALLASVLILTPQVSRHLTIAFFASITAIIVCDSSLGRTLRNCSMVLFAVAVSSTSSILGVELFGRSQTAMVLCMTLTASLVAYPDIHVIRRKFGLAYTAICFIGFAVLPGESITFPLRFGVSAVLGTQCAVIAMLLPAPLQATSLVKDRAELAARSLAALLSTQLGAFCNTDARSLAKAKTQAGMLRRAVLDNVQSMKEREEELWWEFAGGKPTAKLKRILKVFDALLVHSASLDLALQSGHIHESPKMLFDLLRGPVLEMGSWTGAVLQAAVDDFRGRKGSLEEAERLVGHGTDLLKRFNITLQAARERVYYGLKASATLPETVSAEKEEAMQREADSTEGLRKRRRSRVETLMRCSVESLIVSQFFLFHTRHVMQEAFSLIGTDSSVTRPDQRAPKRRSLIQSMMPEPRTQPCQNPACATARWSHSETDADFAPLRGSNGKQVTSAEGAALTRSEMKKGGAWRWADVLAAAKRVRLDDKRVKRSIRVALAISVTAVIGMATDKSFPFLAPATVGVLFGGYQGATFRTALNRFLGTVAGSMYGYIAIVLVHGHPVGVGALLVPWVAVTTFARYSKAYGYSSVVAAFTAAIIMMGYKSSSGGIKEYALGRITQTWIGIITFVAAETFVWPSRASVLVREALVASLKDARACFAAVVRSYMEDECLQCRMRAVDQVASTEKRCSELIAKQGPLVEEAAAEPDLWRAPFFTQGYIKLVELQKKITLLLYAMDCSLRATTKDASGEHSEKLVRPLQGPLRTLEAEVLLILDASIIALQKPSRNGKASEKAESPSKAQQAELMPAVKRPDSNVDDPTIVRERAGLQTGTNKTGGLTGNTGGLTNGRGEGDRPEVDEASNLGQATNLMDTHPDQGSTAKQEANGPKEGVPDKIRDKVSSSSREQIPADPLSTPAELGRSPGKTNHEKHHKHRFFSRHHVSKKVEPLPFDEEVFQHPIPVTGDDVSRLGAVSVQTVLREFEHRYEDVISGLISAKLAHPDMKIVDNGALLSFNALVFSMRALIAEATELENAVRELLQVESPINLARCIPLPYLPHSS